MIVVLHFLARFIIKQEGFQVVFAGTAAHHDGWNISIQAYLIIDEGNAACFIVSNLESYQLNPRI